MSELDEMVVNHSVVRLTINGNVRHLIINGEVVTLSVGRGAPALDLGALEHAVRAPFIEEPVVAGGERMVLRRPTMAKVKDAFFDKPHGIDTIPDGA